LHGEPTGHPLQFRPRELHRVDPYATFGSPERHADDGALPRHEHGQSRHLAEVHVGREPDPPFGGAHRRQVLDAVPEQRLHVLVGVASEGKGDDGGLLWEPQPVGHVLIESHQAGHLVELTHRLPVHRRFPLQHVAIGRRHLLAPLTVPNRNQRSSPEPVCPTLPLGCVEVSARPHPYLTSPRVSVPADALVLSHPADWQEAVADVAGPQLILAGPGTGKTEFLARRVAHLLGSGVPATRLLVLTFSRRAAAELEARISAFLPRPVSGANAST